MPSSRVFYFLTLTTLLVVVGVVQPWLARLAVGLDGVLVLAFFVDVVRGRRATLGAERHWPPVLAQGAEAEIRLTVSGDDGRALTVRLRETLHPGLAAAPERTELELPAAGRLSWTYRIRPRRRGEHQVGPLMARLLGPWRLAWTQRRLLPGEARKVYPQVRWDGKVGRLLLLAHRRSLGDHPQHHQGIGTEPYALREYLPGDPPSRIQWKASARHGRLVTREDTWERGARLLVLLDCGRSMSGLAGQRSKLDHALAAALALVRVAVARGDRVSLAAFSDHIECTLRLHGTRGVHLAYSQIYDLAVRHAEPAFDLAAETAVQLESRRSTVVLFTSVVDLAAAELLRAAVLRLERRHRPILINLEDPELLGMALDPPATANDAFAKVAALEILLANRRLGMRLRHAGIRVVSAAADRLALEALEAYLDRFR